MDYIYILSTSGFFLILAFIIKKAIDRTERRKIRKLERRKNLEAVETETPIEDHHEFAMERGLDNIEMRFTFIKQLLYPGIFTLWAIVSIVPYLGNVPKIYTSLVVGAITVIIGVAARPFIENIFAGMALSFSNSLRVGDTVEIDGQYGTVESIDLTYSTIKIWDWKRYMVPNTRLMQKDFINYSLHDKFVWTTIEFTVARSSDLAQVQELAIQSVLHSPHFDQKRFEKPSFWVMNLEKDHIKCWVAAWCNNPSEAWELRHDIRIRLGQKLKEADVRSMNHYYHINETYS